MTKNLMGGDGMNRDEEFLSRFKNAQDVSSELDVSATMSGVKHKLRRKAQVRNSVAASVLVLAGIGVTANVLTPENKVSNQVILASQAEAIQVIATDQYPTSTSAAPSITKKRDSALYIFGDKGEISNLLVNLSAAAGIQNQLFETGYGMALISTLPIWQCSILVSVFEDENLTRPIASQIFDKKFAAKTVQLKLTKINSNLESVHVVSSCQLPNKTTIFKVDKVNKQ